jgi:hypothetical protein
MSTHLIAQANQLVSEGKPRVALDLLLAAYKLDSTDLKTTKTIGRIYLFLKEPERAATYLTRAVDLESSVKAASTVYDPEELTQQDLVLINEQTRKHASDIAGGLDNFGSNESDISTVIAEKYNRVQSIEAPTSEDDLFDQEQYKNDHVNPVSAENDQETSQTILKIEDNTFSEVDDKLPLDISGDSKTELDHNFELKLNHNYGLERGQRLEPKLVDNVGLEPNNDLAPTSNDNVELDLDSDIEPTLDDIIELEQDTDLELTLGENLELELDDDFELILGPGETFELNIDEDDVDIESWLSSDELLLDELDRASQDDEIFDWDTIEDFDESTTDRTSVAEFSTVVPAEIKARQQAAEIIDANYWDTAVLGLLVDFFLANSHGATRKVIREYAEYGMVVDELMLAWHLRDVWQQTPRFWMTFGRIKSNVEGETAPAYANLSWAQAIEITRSFIDLPSEEELEDFLEEEFQYWYWKSSIRRRFPAFIIYLKYRSGRTVGSLPGWESRNYDPSLEVRFEMDGSIVSLESLSLKNTLMEYGIDPFVATTPNFSPVFEIKVDEARGVIVEDRAMSESEYSDSSDIKNNEWVEVEDPDDEELAMFIKRKDLDQHHKER